MTDLEKLAMEAAARQNGTLNVDPKTEERKKKKKLLAITMLVLNGVALVLVALGFFFDLLPCTLVGTGIAVVSFVISRICKRI